MLTTRNIENEKVIRTFRRIIETAPLVQIPHLVNMLKA